MNLIWTDFAAFMTVGTKTGFEGNNSVTSLRKRDDDIAPLGERAVYKHKHVVTYSNIYYAIPAFIACAAWCSLLFLAISLGCLGRIRWGMLQHYVNQTSMGRTATSRAAPPQPCDPTARTKIWASTAGAIILDVPRWRPSSGGDSTTRSGFQPLVPHNDGEDMELRGPVPTTTPSDHQSSHLPSPAAISSDQGPGYSLSSASDAVPSRFDGLRRTTNRRASQRYEISDANANSLDSCSPFATKSSIEVPLADGVE